MFLRRWLRVRVFAAGLACVLAACQSGMHIDGTSWRAHHNGSVESIAFHDGVADIIWDMTRMSIPYRAHGDNAIEVSGDGIHWVLTMNSNGQLDAVDSSGAPMHFVKQ